MSQASNGRSGGRPASGKRRSAAQTTRRKAPKRPRTAKQKLKRVGLFGLLAALIFGLLGLGAFAVAYNTIEIPDPNKAFQTQTSYIYYADGKTELGTFHEQNRQSIPYDEMPQDMKDAVVAAENRTFWTDNGIDPKGILRAAFSNARGGTTQGASTITQQYVKILYLSQEQTYTRKAKEAILSLKLQRTETKQEILEGYLNTIYFGRGAYGIQAAAGAYFGKPASQLTLRECAVLAAVLNNPSRYDPGNGKDAREALKPRYAAVLEAMAEEDYITAEEAEEAARRLPKFPKIQAEDSYAGQRGHALKLIKDELRALGFSDEEIDGGGLRVTTTLDKDVMEATEESVLEVRPEGFSDKQLHVGVASVEVGTGALRGFYGGQDFLQSQINWAVAGGMAGSTMKAVTLAAALQDGFSLKDTFQGNAPYDFGGGLEVRNSGQSSSSPTGHSYGSAISAVFAMEESVNTAFVDMTDSMEDGPRKVYETGLKMGLTPQEPQADYPGIPATTVDFTPEDALITLGKAQTSPINMANTFATIANGGERANVHVIDKVVDRNGTVLYDFKNRTKRAIPEDVAADVSYSLQQVVENGTGAAVQALGRPAAGKTGTATNDDNEVSSAWFAGYTPQLATAVMYVRGKGREALDGWLPSYFGADYPADTFTAVMGAALEGEEVLDFPEPAWVDGDAPEDGHAPLPPPPPPAPEDDDEPEQKPEKKPTKKPDPTPQPQPTPQPEPTPQQPQPQPTTPEPQPTPTCGGPLGPPCSGPTTGGAAGGGGGTGTPAPAQPAGRAATRND